MNLPLPTMALRSAAVSFAGALCRAMDADFSPLPEVALGEPIERRSGLTGAVFHRDYVAKNKPVIITDALDDWPALGTWTPRMFAERFGDRVATFRDGSQATMKEFVPRVEASSPENPAPYWTNVPLEERFPELLEEIRPRLPHFAPNWGERKYLAKGMQKTLNRGAIIELYLGGNGGQFPILHWDGMSSHAFLMQIYGRKRYYAWPPEDTPFMYPDATTPNISPIRDVERPDLEKYPAFAKARLTTFVLEPGEMLFVPSRWWHSAKMLTPSITLSINTYGRENWEGFTEDMSRHGSGPVRWAKRAYVTLEGWRNRLQDRLSRQA